MAKYTVEFSQDVSVEVDLPPNLPTLAGVTFAFRPETDGEFGGLMEQLDVAVDDVTQPMQWRYGVPVCRDGEKVGSAEVFVYAPGIPEVARPPIPAVMEAKTRRAKRKADAVALERRGDALVRTAPMPITLRPGQGA